MTTKIITVEATPPAESTGADYYKGAPLNAAEFDQNLVNLRAAVDRKASLSNPTFTGTVTLPSTTSIGDVSSTELQYLNSVTSNVQDQINSKAPINNPTFTGTVSLSTGTSNGVLYLNGSKVATSGSVLTFDGSKLSYKSATMIKSLSAGTSTFSSGAYGVLSFNEDYSAGLCGIFGGTSYGYLRLNVPTGADIGFTINGSTAMTLDSSGNLGIGTASPFEKLHVNGNVLFGTSGAASNIYHIAGWSGGTCSAWKTTSDYYGVLSWSNSIYDTASGPSSGTYTERMRLYYSGNLTISGSTATKASGTTWANPSDQRLKDNIRDYEKGLVELLQVRVREWEYNGKGGTTEGLKGLGVVADEIETILPNTVETYEAKLEETDEEVTTIKKFDATEITWLLVNAVKELTQRIEALEYTKQGE